MDFASIQAQLANLTSQLSQYAERTTMQSVPTFGAFYRQGYQVNECPQRDWSNHSTSMWWEARQAQHQGYWQPYEEFYSRPMQPPQPQIQFAQSNSGSTIDYDQILNELNSLVQGSLTQEAENQTKRMKNQAKKMDELEKQVGQIMEFMAQIQEQSELSNSTIENLKENFEIHDAITLESGMEGGTSPKTSKPSQNMDEQLLFEEEEDDKATAREEPPLPQPTLAPLPLPQPPNAPPLSNTGKLGPIFVNSNPIPPNVPFPRRFFIPKQEESEKDIVAAFPKVHNDTPILGATNQVLDCVEMFKGLCTPRRMIHEEVVVGEYVECIKEAVFETTKPKEVEFDDTGQVTTIIVNLAKCKVPETFKDVVFVIEFLSNKASKPSSPISNSFFINMLLILIIQAPTLEFKPLPDHFKYHLPFKDQLQAVGSNGK